MAIRKRYVGKIRVAETTQQIFVEGAKVSKVEKTIGKPDEIKELFSSLTNELKIKLDEIDAFVASNSMSGLFGIPEFMRYVFPSVFGSQKVFFEVGCEEAAGLCAIVKAVDLIKSGLFSRVCVISVSRAHLKHIDEISNIIFSDITSKITSTIKEYMDKRGYGKEEIKKSFNISFERSKHNPIVQNPTLKKIEKIETDLMPQFLNGAGICIIASESVAKSKEIKVEFVGEKTVPEENGKLISVIELSKIAYEKTNIKPDEIDIFEVYDFIPPMTYLWAESLGLDEKKVFEKMNLSGGVFFANCPPASSFIRFYEVFSYLKNKKKGKRQGKIIGLASAITLRTLSHSSMVILSA